MTQKFRSKRKQKHSAARWKLKQDHSTAKGKNEPPILSRFWDRSDRTNKTICSDISTENNTVNQKIYIFKRAQKPERVIDASREMGFELWLSSLVKASPQAALQERARNKEPHTICRVSTALELLGSDSHKGGTITREKKAYWWEGCWTKIWLLCGENAWPWQRT